MDYHNSRTIAQAALMAAFAIPASIIIMGILISKAIKNNKEL